MKEQKNLREKYIQLVETFITAIESGRPGTELENIRKEIRLLSENLNGGPAVENHTHKFDFPAIKTTAEKSNSVNTTIN
jgi:hypothetical protein